MPAAPDQQALPDAERARLFAGLTGYRKLVLAVSGGSDSMALMALFRDHRAADPTAPEAIVATIDHGLRAGSADDAAFVLGAAEAMGFAAVKRRWEGDKPGSDIQAAARDARYALLEEVACEVGADAVLTAHTRDDQAETFLIRLSRGSALKGLTAMAPVRRLGRVDLVRPLLGIDRDRLRASLAAAGIGFRDDPSNENARFTRVRMRRLMPALTAEGIDARRLAETADRLARADRAIDHMVESLAAATLDVHPGGFLSLPVQALAEAQEEVRLRLLVAALGWVGGGLYGPRLERLERAMARLLSDEQARLTLAGARLIRRSARLFVCRESGREGLAEAEIAPGASTVWDGRIRVRLGADAPERVAVRAVGPSWRRLGGDAGSSRPPAAALATVPALFCGDRPVAVPAFGHFASSAWERSVRAEFVTPPPGRVPARS